MTFKRVTILFCISLILLTATSAVSNESVKARNYSIICFEEEVGKISISDSQIDSTQTLDVLSTINLEKLGED